MNATQSKPAIKADETVCLEGRYAIRQGRSREGRWVVVRAGYPNDVRAHAFTRWGARRVARSLARRDRFNERYEVVA